MAMSISTQESVPTVPSRLIVNPGTRFLVSEVASVTGNPLSTVGETGDNCNSFWKIECNSFLIVTGISKWAQFERFISLL